jgi:hypothetical protein
MVVVDDVDDDDDDDDGGPFAYMFVHGRQASKHHPYLDNLDLLPMSQSSCAVVT